MMKRHRALLMSVEALVITREQGPSFLPYFFCLCSLAALSWPLAFSAFPYVSLSFFLFFFFFHGFPLFSLFFVCFFCLISRFMFWVLQIHLENMMALLLKWMRKPFVLQSQMVSLLFCFLGWFIWTFFSFNVIAGPTERDCRLTVDCLFPSVLFMKRGERRRFSIFLLHIDFFAKDE